MSQSNKPNVPQIEYDLFCRRVGHLFIMFARIEGSLSSSLRLQLLSRLGTSPESIDLNKSFDSFNISSAVYGSMRYQAAKDMFKRMMDIQNIESSLRQNIDITFNQIGEIQKFRDILAHQQVMRLENQQENIWYIQNAVTLKSITGIKVQKFHVDVIADATDDLSLILDIFGNGPVVSNDIIPDPTRFETLPKWKFKPSLLTLSNKSLLEQ